MLRKLITTGFILFLFSLSVFGYSEDNLSALEYERYGTYFPNESLSERLNRLETDYFGMSQTGDIDLRIANLSKVNSNAKNGINLPFDGYNNTKTSKFRNFWNNLNSVFNDNGYMTGFTPSMNTTSTSGYSNDIYDNLYRNNMQSFCPYNHPRIHHSNHRYYNRHLNNRRGNFNGVNRFTPNRFYPNRFNPNIGYYPNINRPYVNSTRYYTPPNFETKSSIHILRD